MVWAGREDDARSRTGASAAGGGGASCRQAPSTDTRAGTMTIAATARAARRRPCMGADGSTPLAGGRNEDLLHVAELAQPFARGGVGAPGGGRRAGRVQEAPRTGPHT